MSLQKNEKLIWYIFTISLVVACTGKPDPKVTTAFQVSIPDTTSDKWSHQLYGITMSMCNFFQIERLDKGSDSIQIRVWYIDSLEQTNYLYFGYTKSRWYSFKTTYWYSNYKLDSLKTVRISSRDTVQLAVRSIVEADIQNIPTQEEIPGFDRTDTTDIKPNYFLFEIATKQYYKLLHYYCPSFYDDRYGYHRKIDSLIKIIRRIEPMPFCKLN